MTGTLDDIDVALAGPGDVDDIVALRVAVLGWDPRAGYVAAAITDGHAVVARERHSRTLVGFRYQHALTGDTLGDGLMLVVPAWRRRGVGSALVEHFEATAPSCWALSVVVNTDLVAAASPKPPATSFWVACGYTLVADTGATRVLVKSLPAPLRR